jgi:hypothetical protein
MAPWALGGAHSQAGKVVAIGAALRKLKLPKASPVMIQSTASEVMAILVPVFIVLSSMVRVRCTHHGPRLKFCCDLNHSELRPLPRRAGSVDVPCRLLLVRG